MISPRMSLASTLTMIGVLFTGGSLNPARSFGPDVVHRKFDGYHWIYWLGPLLGAIFAVIFYRLIKALEYETANPGADFDGQDRHHHGSRADTHYEDAHHSKYSLEPLHHAEKMLTLLQRKQPTARMRQTLQPAFKPRRGAP
jgi:aquaporin related protein